jgi:hypothetical protein
MGTGHGPTRVTVDEWRHANRAALIRERERQLQIARDATAEVARLDALIEQAPAEKPRMTDEDKRRLFRETAMAADRIRGNQRRAQFPD